MAAQRCGPRNSLVKILPHHLASTVLLFSESRRTDYVVHLAHFKTGITWEEIESAFPDRAEVWAVRA